MSMRAISDDGSELGWSRTFVRELLIKNLLFSITGLITHGVGAVLDILWPLWDRNAYGLHDKMARTLVVSQIPVGAQRWRLDRVDTDIRTPVEVATASQVVDPSEPTTPPAWGGKPLIGPDTIPLETFITTMVRWRSIEELAKTMRIGEGGRRINGITHEQVSWFDENWVRWNEKNSSEMILLASREESDIWNNGCVGCRGVVDNPRWVALTGKPETKFVFDSTEALDGQLIVPLDAAGWHTFDTNGDR
jgi:hypothetical protein